MLVSTAAGHNQETSGLLVATSNGDEWYISECFDGRMRVVANVHGPAQAKAHVGIHDTKQVILCQSRKVAQG